jgi:DNA polymerase-4
VAKIASSLCKPDGLLEVRPLAVRAFLRPLAVSNIWGVGPVTHAGLVKAGITTIGDLADARVERLRAVVGRAAASLQTLARGEDDRVVDPARDRKSCGEENTFATDVEDSDELRRTIVAHAEAVAARLRAERVVARTVVLKAKLARRIGPGKYPLLTRSRTLAMPTDDGRTISSAALDLWSEVAAGTRIRLIGVSASNLAAASAEQLPLFASRGGERRVALNQALDTIAAKFGEGALRRGGAEVERASPTLSIKRRGDTEA